MVKTNAILAVVLVIILVGGGLFLFFPEEAGATDATATIYIENADSGEVMVAEMDISKLSFTEAMMLSAYGEVREVDFKPLEFTGSISALSANGNYNMWIVAKAKVSATDDIASLTKIQYTVSGKPGTANLASTTPDHATTTLPEKLWTVSGTASATIFKTSATFGTEYTFDQSAATEGKFNRVYNSDTKALGTLNGDRIDGSVITVQISAYAVDDSGQTVVNTATATMKIVVNSYSQSALSVVITGISIGGYAAA
jgi:WD40 repeat protein